jgi:hypothetical protein
LVIRISSSSQFQRRSLASAQCLSPELVDKNKNT